MTARAHHLLCVFMNHQTWFSIGLQEEMPVFKFGVSESVAHNPVHRGCESRLSANKVSSEFKESLANGQAKNPMQDASPIVDH